VSGITFCSNCGERITSIYGRFWLTPSACTRCSPLFRRRRRLMFAVTLLCLSAVFAIGRFTAPRRPFYIIGTPIDLKARQLAANEESQARETNSGEHKPKTADGETGSYSICGALTKSGKRCQRRVKGGGRCWQHQKSAPAGTGK
jgi:hypothetical protein